MGMACANDGGGYEVLYRWCQLNIAEWGGLIGSVKEGKFLDEIWVGGGGMGGGGGTKLLSTVEVICQHSLKLFLSYSKNYIYRFMQANSWHHKLFHFHLLFESEKCGKEVKKLQKFEYPREQKDL